MCGRTQVELREAENERVAQRRDPRPGNCKMILATPAIRRSGVLDADSDESAML